MYYIACMGYKQAEKYSLHPDSQSGKFQHKLDTALSFKMEDQRLYPMEVPMRSERTGRRKVTKILVQPAHEALEREVRERPEILAHWRDTVDGHGDSEWISQYENHPHVKQATPEGRKDIKTTVLYMDGADFDKKRWAFYIHY